MNFNPNSSEQGVLVDKELAKFLAQFKLEDLDTEFPNMLIRDISDTQLEHALALSEQLQELESELEEA